MSKYFLSAKIIEKPTQNIEKG